MKVIGLVPFKNEEWILPTYLSNVLPVVDEVIAIDDGSTDNSKKIMEDAGVKVYGSDRIHDMEYGASITPRENLLRLGRESGGTHFVMLDADETFTTNFIQNAREVMSQMKPGQKLIMQWLALWKSWDKYRDDNTPWSNNFKDFIFCDDGTSNHSWDGKSLHTIGRTPVSNGQEYRLSPEHGAVLHYQFSNFNLFQFKQVWYRVKELSLYGNGNENTINSTYSITLLDENVRSTQCPDSWIEGIELPEDKTNFDPNWETEKLIRTDYLEDIFSMFDVHGVEYFEGLNIWHIPQLRNRFIKDTGREPK